jgi:hypothetical protein
MGDAGEPGGALLRQQLKAATGGTTVGCVSIT